jgi:hypothetical protein
METLSITFLGFAVVTVIDRASVQIFKMFVYRKVH